MKNIFTALFLLLLFSCKENGVQLGKPSTFVRYFNGGFPDVAQTIIKTSDGGYLILANTQTTATSTYYRIKLIKVDAFGNEKWQGLYPDPNPNSPPPPNFRGFGLIEYSDASGGGYLIVGDSIYDDSNNGNARAHGLLMIKVSKKDSDKGKLLSSVTKTYNILGSQVRGVSVAQSSTTGNFIVIGENILDATNPSHDIFYGEFNGTSLNKIWTQSFGDGETTLSNKLFLNADSAYWSGTDVFSGTPKMRFVKSKLNQTPTVPLFYPNGGNGIFTCNDICQYGNGFGLIGSYSSSAGSYNKIAFFRVNEHGTQPDSAKFDLSKSFAQSNQFEAGNSIGAAYGGFIILGTIAGDATATADTNYLLIRTDSHGNELWRKEYGGTFRDIGCKVLEANDGGYLVLGTTTLANVQSIFLMKTDSNGGIQ